MSFNSKTTFQQTHREGPSIKDVCSQGMEGGLFRCGRPHFLMQKTADFSKFYVCPHGQGGLTQCGQGGGGEFLWMSFLDSP